MTNEQILAQVAAGKITPSEACVLIAANAPKAGGSARNALYVGRNKAGGVFIRHPKFIAHSTAKDKDYVAGLNLDANVAKVLFSDKAVYEEIAKAVAALVS